MKSITTSLLLILCSKLCADAQTISTVQLRADVVLTLPAKAGLAAIADGDFNHDGRRDLAVCERTLNQVALYMRSATGTYPKAKFTYSVGQSPSGLVTFARNLAIPNYNLMTLSGPSGQWTVLRDDQDTTGNLVRRVLTPGFGTSDPSPRPVLVQADINHDGTPDFAYTYPVVYNSFMTFDSYYNDTYIPTPHPGRQVETPYFNTQSNNSSNLTLADFDLDGYLDEVVTDSAGSVVHVITQFQRDATQIESRARGPVHTAAEDIDGDQLADLAIAYAGSNEVVVLRTAPLFAFNRAYSYTLPASPRRVLLADLNRDHNPELLVVTADNKLRVYQHDGSGSSLSYTTSAPLVLNTGDSPTILQVVDLNNDLYPDIVVGCAGDNTIHTYLNRSGTITASQTSQTQGEIEVYPTVTTDQITIRSISHTPLVATLLDEVGRTVWQQEVTFGANTLTVGSLPRGLYLLRLIDKKVAHSIRITLK